MEEGKGRSQGHLMCRAQLTLQDGFLSETRFSYIQSEKGKAQTDRCSATVLEDSLLLHPCVCTHRCAHTRGHTYTHTHPSPLPSGRDGCQASPHKPAAPSSPCATSPASLSSQYLDPETGITDDPGELAGLALSYYFLL